MLTVKVQRQCR